MIQFEKLLEYPEIIKYHGYKEYEEFTAVYITIKTNHKNGNLNVTLRPTSILLLENNQFVLEYLYDEIKNIIRRIDSGDTWFIVNN